MSLLSALIQKRETRKAATAIPAIPAISATQPKEGAATVAGIATVAVANPTDAKTTDAVTSWGWLLHFADREPLEVYCNPDATHAEILERYPDALAAEPIPERTRHKATPEQEAELRALVASVGAAYGFTHAEQTGALALALSDPDAALMSYQAMATELSVTGAMEKVIGKLQTDLSLRYAMETDTSDPNAVILTLAIKGKGACELRIPKSRYDAFALLELIEKHTTRETLQ